MKRDHSSTCSCKCLARCFHSKGAFMVIFWQFLVSTVAFIQLRIIDDMTRSYQEDGYRWIVGTPLVLATISAPLSGWLADSKVGNYSTFRAGLLLLWISTILNCIRSLLKEQLTQPELIVLDLVSSLVTFALFIVGFSACLVTSMQQGLDQMPDATTSNITSFIAWFTISTLTGYWISELFHQLAADCIEDNSTRMTYTHLWNLLLVMCISSALVIDFILARRWLIIEPKSPQSLRIIFNVLKFAARHKAPIYRSALTYWEDKIPSRIDLGKSKYSGPFTTEEVEDVKTILRMIVISLSFLVMAISFTLDPLYRQIQFGLDGCSSSILQLVTLNRAWCALTGALLYELIAYPLVRNIIPSTLKRIGLISFLAAMANILCLVLKLLHHYYDDTAALKITMEVLYSSSNGMFFQLFFTSVVEFACAQSPYKMRGLFMGYEILVIVAGILIGDLLHNSIKRCAFFIPHVVTAALSLVSFLLHCILAKWYKRRVREDIYPVHRVVEEVYDRYLSARN